MGSVFKVNVVIPPAIAGLVRRLSPSGQSEVVRRMGEDVARDFGRFFTRASRTRHKTARRFGAEPTGLIEFDDGNPPRSRGGATITSSHAASTATIRISGIPFLSRAYGDMHIAPKKAHCLTIPISREAFRKSAGELRSEGWSLFTLGNRGRFKTLPRRRNGILFGSRGGGDIVPLFALVKNAIIPQDRGLMPTEAEIGSWAADSARRSVLA